MLEGNIAVPLQPVGGYNTRWALDPHFSTHNFQLPPLTKEISVPPAGRSIYTDNATLWRDVISEFLEPHSRVELMGFYLFRWFPRSPGLYHTDQAHWARQEAFHYLDPQFPHSPIRDHAMKIGQPARPMDYTVVFTPEGKSSMLEGGIGSIYLKPIAIEGNWHWLMTASSDGVAHRGFPLAVPQDVYDSMKGRVFEQGGVRCRIQGSIEILPHPFSGLFDGYVGVPTVYLKVSAAEPEAAQDLDPGLEVSVAVSFLGEHQGRRGLFATYVTFNPSLPNTYEDAIHWMKEEYVEGAYNGRIVTDFNQIKTTFPEAKLALRRIMDRQIRRDELEETVALTHAYGDIDRYYDQLVEFFPTEVPGAAPRTNIFISYAHAEFDRSIVERVRIHLKALGQVHNVDIWDDGRIRSGARWEEDITKALDSAKIAIVVISADFMASEFIQRVELPTLLEMADAGGLTVIPIMARRTYVLGHAIQLEQFQFVNDPKLPLETMTDDEREDVYARLVREIASLLGRL